MNETMDSDTNQWLRTMLQTGQKPIQTQVASEDHLYNYCLLTKVIQSTNAKVMEVLLKVDDWSFDIFELERVTNGRPLFHLGMALFEAYNIESAFDVNPQVLAQFLNKVESTYQKNPYHNSTHAADVLNS